MDLLNDSHVVIALVGTKVDIASKREVTTHEGENLAEKTGAIFMEISAKTGENIYEIFTEIARRVTIDVSRTDSISLSCKSGQRNITFYIHT